MLGKVKDSDMESGRPIPPRLNQPQPMSGRVGLGLSLVAPATIALLALLHLG